METMFDYIHKIKNKTMDEVPLNEIDIALFCILAYLPWDYIVPPPHRQNGVSLESSVNKFNRWNYASDFHIIKDKELLRLLKNTNRYDNVIMSNYVNHYDKLNEIQFSAITFLLPDEKPIIVFRGTDDTLIGWKEDFNMSFETPIKSQEEAMNYLNHIIPTIENNCIIAGHSKGGNLAIYSSIFTEEKNKKKIETIYNFDGPGFLEEITTSSNYQQMKEKVQTFVPESSIIGMLLEQTETYTIIKSYQIGILQHSLYSWIIQNNQFIKLKKVTSSSIYINQTLKEWIGSLSKEEREKIIDSLYQIFDKTGALTISGLTANWVQNSKIMIESFHDMDYHTKFLLLNTLIELFKISKKNLSLYLKN